MAPWAIGARQLGAGGRVGRRCVMTPPARDPRGAKGTMTQHAADRGAAPRAGTGRVRADVVVRPATAGDATAIAAIWNPVIRDTLVTFTTAQKTEDDLRAMLEGKASAGLGFFVAVDDRATVLGFATYGPFRAGPGYRHTMEHTIVLAPDARGRGTGRALMLAVERHARARGVHSLWAGVSAGNPDGRAFHAALGYAEIAVLPEVGYKFGRWLDLVLMQKILD